MDALQIAGFVLLAVGGFAYFRFKVSGDHSLGWGKFVLRTDNDAIIVMGLGVLLFTVGAITDGDENDDNGGTTSTTVNDSQATTQATTSEGTTQPTSATTASDEETTESTVLCADGSTEPSELACPLVINVTIFEPFDWKETVIWRPEEADDRGSFGTDYGQTLEYTANVIPAEGETAAVDIQHIYTRQCWDPAARGALATVRMSLRRAAPSATPAQGELNEFAVGERFGLEQDGQFSFVTNEAQDPVGFSHPDFRTRTTDELGEDSFEPQPDFSASAERICFGLLRTTATGRGGGVLYRHSLDDFQVVAMGGA